jgi:hypothetical protein
MAAKRTRIYIKNLKGEPAEWLHEWKERRRVTSDRDAVMYALRVFHEQIVEEDQRNGQRVTLMRSLGKEMPNNGGEVEINVTISGEVAQYLEKIVERGLARDKTDAIIQAFRALRNRFVEIDIKDAQLQLLKGESNV